MQNFIVKLDNVLEQGISSESNTRRSRPKPLSEKPPELLPPSYPSSGRLPPLVLEKYGLHVGDTVRAIDRVQPEGLPIPEENQ